MSFRSALLGVTLVALLAACSGKEKEEKQSTAAPTAGTATKEQLRQRDLHRIDSLEAEIRKAIQTPERNPDVRLAMYMIKAYHYFALDYPRDARAPAYLDRAGQLYAGVLGDYGKAIEFYEKAYNEYPKYPKRPNLIFQEAVAFDAAGDTAATVGTYKRLLLTYPNHPLAKEATQLLRLARMTPAEQKAFFSQQQPSAKK